MNTMTGGKSQRCEKDLSSLQGCLWTCHLSHRCNKDLQLLQQLHTARSQLRILLSTCSTSCGMMMWTGKTCIESHGSEQETKIAAVFQRKARHSKAVME